MEQLLLHLLGDFIIQNDTMALKKKNKGSEGFYYCAVHCLTYALPFLLIANVYQVSLIFTAHFILDRWNLISKFLSIRNHCTINHFGFNLERPMFIVVWLNIITDNSFHLIFNFLILRYL